MSIKDKGPTRPQFDEFVALCDDIVEEDRRPRDHNTPGRNRDV